MNNKEIKNTFEYNYENINKCLNIDYNNQDEDNQYKSIISIIYSKIVFINIGACCFINSIVQVLIHSRPFIESITKKINILKNLKLSITYKLFQIIEEILNLNSNLKYVDISYFNNFFGIKHPNYNGLIQQDSQEFLRLLLADISLDLNEVNINLHYTILENDDFKNKIERYMEFRNHVNKNEKSIITELFYHIIITTYICKCKKEIYAFQRMLDIPLLLPAQVTKISIEALINNYFKDDEIEFKDISQNCGQIKSHIKKIQISKLPNILILSLQRLDFINNIKNTCDVAFSSILDMKPYIDKECENSNNILYHLYGIIYHIGEIDFGHYVSFINIFGQNYWYEFNDSIINNVGIEINRYSDA